MRLSAEHMKQLKRVVFEEGGPRMRLRLFGSRLDDAAVSGDVDLLLELDEPVAEPAWLAARKVDVVLAAPNLVRLPIHEVAFRRGVEL